MTMRKETPFQDYAEWGRTATVISNETLNKIASEEFVPPKIASCIAEIQSSPDTSMVYMYDRALGAGEYYRANNNGDYFPEGMLRRDHPTFEKHAKLYRNHVTSAEPTGDVMCAEYNDKLHTVDLITRAPLAKVAAEDARLRSGFTVKTSMGASVPYDVCSICGHQAKTRVEYCDHVRYNKHRLVNGRQVYMINPQGVFKDISIVVVPAAPESSIIHKIASLHAPQPAFDKRSTMYKRVPGNMRVMHPREIRGAVQPRVIQMLSHIKTADALATLSYAVGIIRPDEFMALLYKEASMLRPDEIPVVYRDVQPMPCAMGSVFSKLAHHIQHDELQYAPDEVKVASWMDDHARGLYLEYREMLPASIKADSRYCYLR
jgi:hypothetical protein